MTYSSSIPVGFTTSPGGEAYRNRSALSYHYYSPPAIGLEGNFKTRNSDIKRLQIGGMLTEFFVTIGKRQEKINVLKTCDKYKQSWIGWSYKPFVEDGECSQDTCLGNGFYNKDGSVIQDRVHDLARSYAQKVAGFFLNFINRIYLFIFIFIRTTLDTCI